MTKSALLVFLALPALAHGQIYRCDTPDGPVFSDKRCGGEAREVAMAEDSSGLGGGPSEEVRAYLDQKRQERAEQREQAARFAPRNAAPASNPVAAPIENEALLPAYPRPVRPIVRPRPRPERPPVDPGDGSGGSTVIRPRGDDGGRQQRP